MTEEILVNAALGEVRIAVVAGGRLRELLIERPEHQSILGSVFLGRVERVVPGVNAAFVDIGLERAGFLGAWEALSPADRRARGTGTSPPIGDTVHEGETVLVQAVKDQDGFVAWQKLILRFERGLEARIGLAVDEALVGVTVTVVVLVVAGLAVRVRLTRVRVALDRPAGVVLVADEHARAPA